MGKENRELQSDSPEIDPRKKREYFHRIAMEHLPEMRLLLRGGKLTKREGWRNVAKHCMAAFVATSILTEALGLSEEDRRTILTAQFVHDWRKRMDIKPGEFTEEEKSHAEKFLGAVDPDPVIMAATGPNIIERSLVTHEASFLERLRAYVDDLCKEGEIVRLKERHEDVRARRQDLQDDEVLEERLGGKFWDRNWEMETATQQEVFERLREQGVDINSPEEIPDFIKRKLAEEIAAIELPEVSFRTETIIDTQRELPELNEDEVVFREDDFDILAGVFDGATAFGGELDYFKELGKSPGKVASELAANVLRDAPLQSEPRELLLRINSALRNEAESMPVSDEAKAELLTTMGFIVHLDKETGKLSYARLGDCMMVLLRERGDPIWLIDEQTEAAEKREIDAALKVVESDQIPMTETLSHPDVIEVVAADRRLENSPDGPEAGGYGTLKGSPDKDIEQYIVLGEFTFQPGDRFFIITDGMVMVQFDKDPEQKKATEDALREGGLEGLLRHTRAIQDADPDCTKYPRFKQSDDAGGVEIRAYAN